MMTEQEYQVAQSLMAEKICDSGFRAEAIIRGLKLMELATDEERLSRAKLYRDWRNSKIFGKQTAPCFEKAIAGEPVPQMTLIEGVMHTEAA